MFAFLWFLNYTINMIELRLTPDFVIWLRGLRDAQAKARIKARLDRLVQGNPGDHKPTRCGVTEMRIDYGPGYRVYYCQRGNVLIVVLAGGTKKTQDEDITAAVALAKTFQE
jgi:putative addiction module killer protein